MFFVSALVLLSFVHGHTIVIINAVASFMCAKRHINAAELGVFLQCSVSSSFGTEFSHKGTSHKMCVKVGQKLSYPASMRGCLTGGVHLSCRAQCIYTHLILMDKYGQNYTHMYAVYISFSLW
jgi:hypothetical protein